jgi:PAS domain S-box-containing protein
MKLRFASTTLGLALGVTAAVLVASTAAAYLYSAHHFQTLLDDARNSALAEGELIRVALEHQMIENDRSLIGRMIESFGKQARVEQLVVLDRNGVERYSSGRHGPAGDFRIDSPTCQACHQYPPEQRGNSRVIETRGGEILRTVVPIRNRQACYRCHDPAHRINGILILDYDAGEIRAAMTKDLRWMVAATAALTLLLVGAIALIIRLFVLRRLQRFEIVARQIAGGDLERRVPAEGSDTIAWLAREFNTMADSVTGLVGEVRSQRERLETIINSIDDGIVVLDPTRQIIAANDAFLRRAAHSREEVLGCCCRDVAPPGACAVEDCPTLSCLSAGDRQIRICERRSPEGATIWEEVHASPVRDSSGKLTQVVEVWRDISERRAAEAHLAESHRLASVGMLASGFSHELNTPLATVLTCVEGILRDFPPGPDGEVDRDRVRDNAAIAREQILRCRGITQHFLRLSRGQRSTGGVVELGSVLAAVERLVTPTARANSVRVELDGPSRQIHLRADEADLQNVLVNLMLNAVQACKPGGRVSVGVAPGDPVRIRVSDDGCGIRPEFRARIFEPFFSMRQGGTGLGLFLSLNSVRRWGGDIRVESETGQGSVFEIVLPAFAYGDEQELAG